MHLHPTTLKQANAFIRAHHRHHPHVRGCLFCLAVSDETALRGVIVVGRPNARADQDGRTACVTRSCTDGTANANSMLYAAARRAAQALHYTRLITYTRHDEPGSSLRGDGWTPTSTTRAKSWDTASRRRGEATQPARRTRWQAPKPPKRTGS